jgi:putative endonuclease
VTLAAAWHFERADEAIAAERQIKGWTRAKKEALIRGDFAALKALSASRTAPANPAKSRFNRQSGGS